MPTQSRCECDAVGIHRDSLKYLPPLWGGKERLIEMKIEVCGNAEKLRTLQLALQARFQFVEFDTSGFETLVVEVLHGYSQCGRVRDFIEAFCVGAGITWNGC